jgi:hypothetical protein
MILRNKKEPRVIVVYYKEDSVCRPGVLFPHKTTYPASYRLGMGWFKLAPNELSGWSK